MKPRSFVIFGTDGLQRGLCVNAVHPQNIIFSEKDTQTYKDPVALSEEFKKLTQKGMKWATILIDSQINIERAPFHRPPLCLTSEFFAIPKVTDFP